MKNGIFHSIKDYISFFENVKNDPSILKRGAIPKVGFGGYGLFYILIPVFTVIIIDIFADIARPLKGFYIFVVQQLL